MSADHFAQRLQRLGTFLRERPTGFPIDDADAIAAGIERFFNRRCTLDEALGLHLDRGEHHPGADEALAKRARALRSAAEKLGPSCTARRLAELYGRYASTAWLRERTLDVCPPQRVGTIEGDFWLAMKAWPRVVGERRMRNLLEDRKNPRQ